MKHLPAVPEGHEVTVILKCGQEIEGKCIQAGDSYVRIACGDVWHIDAEDIAAFGIGGKA
jgi:hypothetical protein